MNPLNETEIRLLKHAAAKGDTVTAEQVPVYLRESLIQLRGAEAYLEKKYPEYKIQYHYFDPMTKLTEKGILYASLGGYERLGKIVIRRIREEYTYADTLYSDPLREIYDAAMIQSLSAVYRLLHAYTVFSTPVSLELPTDASLEQINRHDPQIMRHTELFVKGEPDVSDRLIGVLAHNGFYGSYTLYGVPPWGSTHPDILMESRDRYEKESFFCPFPEDES